MDFSGRLFAWRPRQLQESSMGHDTKRFHEKLNELWPKDDGPPCDRCTVLLRRFAEARPVDFEFLTAADMVDPNQVAFAGIPEWDAFLAEFSACHICHE